MNTPTPDQNKFQELVQARENSRTSVLTAFDNLILRPFANYALSTKFVLGFLVITLIVVASSFLSLGTYASVNAEFTLLKEDVVPGAISMLETDATLAKLRGEVQAMALSGDTSHREHADEAIARIQSNTAEHTAHEIHIGEEEGQVAQDMENRAAIIISLAEAVMADVEAGVGTQAEMNTTLEQMGSEIEELSDILTKHVSEHMIELSTTEAAVEQATATGNTTVWVSMIVAVALAVLVGFLLTRAIVGPITTLTTAVEKIRGGDLNVVAEVKSGDETGQLAGAFNNMTAQLRKSFEDLDRRATELATVAEVGTATATILETDKLLQEVVNLSKERFNLYHSHIYLLDETRENLVLTSGAGEPGRQMKEKGFSIPLDREQSLVARAARERLGVIVNDVTQAPDFLPNPLLPDTRSELAIPMIVGGKVIGVFDVQSDVVGRFTESDINIQTTLATQVATSIQNVRVFEQSKSQADLASLVNAIGQKIQRATTVDDTLQTAIRELGLALGASRVSANIQANRQADGR